MIYSMLGQKGSLFITLPIIGLIILAIGYLIASKFKSAPQEVVQNLEKLSIQDTTNSENTNRIAFIKDQKLFHLVGDKTNFVTDNVYNNKYKFSSDGRYLAWINKAIVKIINPNYPDGYPNEVGVSLSVLDTTDNQVQTLIPRKYSDEMFAKPSSKFREGSIWKYDFDDFDFVDADKIVYLRDGLRTIKISDGQEETLIEIEKTDQDSFPGPATYLGIDASPDGKYLLLLKGGYECDPGITELYNLSLKQFVESDGLGSCDSTHSVWSPGGEYILTYDEGGNVPEGLWTVNINSQKKNILVDKRAVETADIYDENKVAGYLTDYAIDNSSSIKAGIYIIDKYGQLNNLIDTNQVSEISFSPDGKYITYLNEIEEKNSTNTGQEKKFNLMQADLNEKTERVILNDINSYAWSLK